MSIKRFYKIISPKSPSADLTANQDIGGNGGLYGNYTWYNRLIQGSNNRLTRYREYDAMDADIDVARALDIIAREMTGNTPKTDLPLHLHITTGNEQRVPSNTVVTLQAALKTWCKLQSWDTRLFSLVRALIKYGDAFFYRPKKKNRKWVYVHPKNVVGAVVAQDDVTEVKGWHIKTDTKQADNGSGSNIYHSLGGGSSLYDQNVEAFNVEDIIRYTLNDDMSEEAPFGESILRTVYKTFKQKELLEDSVLIYRIVRAPERRVFYIDVGKMPPHKVASHLEQIKNEIKQKKIPTAHGGKSQVESIYNPQSMSEDFFFAQRSDGTGSRVETLPGGQGLGELTELQYFYLKLWRGLHVPASYMGNGGVDDGQAFNDGAVGIAYIQEIKFSEYCEHLQKYVEGIMDAEFKRFLHDININIDNTIFTLQLPPPTNWSKSRQQKIDNDLVAVYNNIKDDATMSKRLAKLKYLQWEQEDLITNERMLREEKGLDPDGGIQDLPKLYFPDEAEAGGFEGGLGSVGGAEGGMDFEGTEGMDEEGMDGEEGGDGEGSSGEEGADADAGNKGTPPPKS